jgi:hypothetical protein
LLTGGEHAKDATHLMEAVEHKLAEQRKFVLWWDGQGHKGGNPTDTGLQRLEDLGGRGKTRNGPDTGFREPDRMTISRWRTRLMVGSGDSIVLGWNDLAGASIRAWIEDESPSLPPVPPSASLPRSGP